MRIDVTSSTGRIRYTLHLGPDDRPVAPRRFRSTSAPLQLAADGWEVALPPSFRGLHPDVHAAAIVSVIGPWVGTTLELPFAVSSRLAEAVHESYGVALARVDTALVPRDEPPNPRRTLLFSGGMDSVAASLLHPVETQHLFLDRIPHYDITPGPDVLVDPAFGRALLHDRAREGREVHIVADDHEALYRPYPMWHTDMSMLPALYLADSLDIATGDTGDVFDVVFMQGYRPEGTLAGWRFRPFTTEGLAPEDQRVSRIYDAIGIKKRASIAGLSEVCTAKIVGASAYRGRTSSCYYPSETAFCMRCDKCFRKYLLLRILAGEEVPADVIDGFLAYPYLASIFDGEYFDWHHIWMYIFQNVRCRHPFVEELARQARGAPDLSVLEKWYPGSRPLMAPEYRDDMEARWVAAVGQLDAGEVARLEALSLPPLHAPERRVLVPVATDLRTTPAAPPVELGPPTDARNETSRDEREGPPRPAVTTVRVTFEDREGRIPVLQFQVARVAPGEPALYRLGETGLGHAPRVTDKLLLACAELLKAVVRRVAEPPTPANVARWEATVRSAFEATPLPRRFACRVEVD